MTAPAPAPAAPAPAPSAPAPTAPASPPAPSVPTSPAAPAAPTSSSNGYPVVPPGAQVADPQQQQPGDDVDDATLASLPPRAQAEIRRLRNESMRYRHNAQSAQQQVDEAAQRAAAQAEAARLEQARGILKALGFDVPGSGDEALTPEQLAAQFDTERTTLQTERDRVREENRRLKHNLAMANAGVSGPAQLALKGSGLLDALDPDAPDYAAQFQSVVDSFFEQYPALRVVTPVAPLIGSSGADFNGSTPPPPGGAQSIDDYRAERTRRRTGTAAG